MLDRCVEAFKRANEKEDQITMKAYVVVSGEYSDFSVDGVYLDKKEAEKFVRYWKQLGEDYWIDDYETDEPLEKPDWIHVKMDRNGNSSCYADQHDKDYIPQIEFRVSWMTTDGDEVELFNQVNTSVPKRAIKVTNEIRSFCLASDCWGDIDKLALLMGKPVKEF